MKRELRGGMGIGLVFGALAMMTASVTGHQEASGGERRPAVGVSALGTLEAIRPSNRTRYARHAASLTKRASNAANDRG